MRSPAEVKECVERARAAQTEWANTPFAERRFARCSQGERQRTLLARALMNRPRIVLLDEPTAGLDLPGREIFLHALGVLARDEPELATITVVHHVEDIPATTTHALLLREGRVVAAGPIEQSFSGETLSATFALPLDLHRNDSRYTATVAPEIS